MTIIDLNRPDQSRRLFLRRAALLTGGGALLALSAISTDVGAAPTVSKKTQASVAYQTTPKGSARCNACDQFLQPSSCKTVLGTIGPTGWCNLYSPKW